jgi:outer membrane biosynthesis protein TonB
MPLVFISVSPEQESVEPPKNAPYYAARNSRAANPEPEKDTNTPRITGEEERLIRTQDVAREQFQPLQPVQQAPVAPQEQEEAKPEPRQKPGDMQIAKADPTPIPQPDAGQAKESRPRTLKEALARKSGSQLPGRKMRQEGGVRQKLDIASLDAKGTAFGAYDQALVEALSARWFDLLYDRDYASDSRGRVVLQFKLHYDGRITDMRVAENTAGEVLGLICQKAVMDPAPFAPWPSDMRRLAGESRSIQFTFYYN